MFCSDEVGRIGNDRRDPGQACLFAILKNSKFRKKLVTRIAKIASLIPSLTFAEMRKSELLSVESLHFVFVRLVIRFVFLDINGKLLDIIAANTAKGTARQRID